MTEGNVDVEQDKDVKSTAEVPDSTAVPSDLRSPGDELSYRLEEALANFSTNTSAASGAIRQLQGMDPLGFAMAMLRLLESAGKKSPGLQYVVSLVSTDNALIDLLLDEKQMTPEAAVALAGKLAAVEPLLDVRLARKVRANQGQDQSPTGSATVLRVLGLVSAISDCSRLLPYLVPLLSHPSAAVRSKTALLLGRANRNLSRVERLLASEDGRVRANAVESLWGERDSEAKKILWQSTRDSCSRVVVNALLGLYRAGERGAHSRLVELASVAEPVTRSGAAWAMGETGNPEFCGILEKLEQDGDANVRGMAGKSLQKLRTLEPAAAAEPGGSPLLNVGDSDAKP